MELFVGEKRLRVYYCNRIILETTADKAADWATASSAIPLEANTLGKVCLGKKTSVQSKRHPKMHTVGKSGKTNINSFNKIAMCFFTLLTIGID